MYIFKTSNTNTNTGLLVYLNTNTYLFPTLIPMWQILFKLRIAYISVFIGLWGLEFATNQ